MKQDLYLTRLRIFILLCNLGVFVGGVITLVSGGISGVRLVAMVLITGCGGVAFVSGLVAGFQTRSKP